MSWRSSSLSARSAGSTSSPSRSAIEASSFAASAWRSPRCAASTWASVSASEAPFISTCSSDSWREHSRISSAISSPPPCSPTTLASIRSTRVRIAVSAAPAAAAAARTSSSSSSPAATRARSASRWRSPSRPSARRAWRAARSAPAWTSPSAASRSDSEASSERARARPAPAPERPASISPSSCSSLPIRSAGAPSLEPRSSVSGPNSARRPSSARSSSASRSPSATARTAIRCCSPRSLVSRPQAWVRSRSRAAKRSSAARRRPLTASSFFSIAARSARAFSRRLLRRLRAVLAEAQFLGDQAAAQPELLALDPRAQLGRLRLALQRPQPRPRLALEVERPVEVVARGAQLQLRPAAAFAVLAETGRLLDQQPALARLGVDDRLDPALADHRVHLAPQVGVGEHLDHVDEPAAGAVEPVDAVAGAVERALHGDLRELGRGPSLGVVDHDLDLGGAAPADALARRPRSRPASRRRGSPPGSARRAPRAPRR